VLAQPISPLSEDSLPSNQKLQSPPLDSIASNRVATKDSTTTGDNLGAPLPRLNNSVLIVDDDVEALDEMGESLHDYGLKVYAASNVGQALKIAKEQRPEFIIMDYLLSGYTGTQAINEIQKFLPETQVIMISAFDDLAYHVTATDFGVVAVLKKPLSMDSIGRFIKNKMLSKNNQVSKKTQVPEKNYNWLKINLFSWVVGEWVKSRLAMGE
jgi:ActR/RegA family two-component response regulator